MKRILISIIFILTVSSIIYPNIDSDESITFFPSYAYKDLKGKTFARIHGWVYEPEENSIKRRILVKILRSVLKTETRNIITGKFDSISRLFLVDNERGQSISIRIRNQTIRLPATGSHGHTIRKFALLDQYSKETIIPYKAVVPAEDTRDYQGTIIYIPPKGISIISDIDDTIKISNVLDKRAMIENTFLKEYTAVSGMSLIYNKLKKRGASFHYVSGSPWQLFLPLNNFMKKNNFPIGSVHFKYFRLKDRSGIGFLSGEQISYKKKVIRSILKDFPKRKFILIGDSGEKDPEVYAAITEEFEDRILAVCIHDIGSRKNDPGRFIRLFKKYKTTEFILFRKSIELNKILNYFNKG